jgi:phosphopentomutase
VSNFVEDCFCGECFSEECISELWSWYASGLPESILADIEARTMRSIQEACEAMLTEWFHRLGREHAITDALIRAMHANDIINVAGQ